MHSGEKAAHIDTQYLVLGTTRHSTDHAALAKPSGFKGSLVIAMYVYMRSEQDDRLLQHRAYHVKRQSSYSMTIVQYTYILYRLNGMGSGSR